MRLVTFTHKSRTRIGLLKQQQIIDLAQANPQLPTDMIQLLALGQPGMAAVREIDQANNPAHVQLPLAEAVLESPIQKPGKILAIGLNYRAHAIESNMEIPKTPFVFTKQSTSINGPYGDIYWSEDSKALDYEGELGIIIGTTCRRVPLEKAPSVIAGFCVMNDVSVRDWQLRGNPSSFTMGKSWDSHCPAGPALVTADEVEPHNLQLKTYVNNELRQDSNTNDLIFNCYELISFISTAFTLEAGDMIVSGTPSGVGFARKPPQMLAVGDVVRVEIEGLGHIENTVVEEPAAAVKY